MFLAKAIVGQKMYTPGLVEQLTILVLKEKKKKSFRKSTVFNRLYLLCVLDGELLLFVR